MPVLLRGSGYAWLENVRRWNFRARHLTCPRLVRGSSATTDHFLETGSTSRSTTANAIASNADLDSEPVAYGRREVVRRYEHWRDAAQRFPQLADQPFRVPREHPLSTFSIDVDTASYSIVRGMVNAGQSVHPNAVRIEEFINYFDYAYPDPGPELPFSVNLDAADCPWKSEHRLVRVGLKGKEIAAPARPPLNLVFLVDVSGSMNQPNKLPLAKQSLHLLVDEMRPQDRIAIATYAGNEGIALAPTSGADRPAIHRAIDNMRSAGGTNGEAGIRLAYRLARENRLENDGGVNRVLLLTDGDFNIGMSSTQGLRDLVKTEARSGTYLSVLGFGSDNLNDAMLEVVTNDGNGTYHFIDGITEGRRVLVDELSSTLVTIAKDVKLQIEFNPAVVSAYRLIGYANRMLPPEAFKDDRVDAGDIGAGHTVTAFYEIVPAGQLLPKPEPTVDELKYQPTDPTPPVAADQQAIPVPVPETVSSEMMTVKLRYKQPDAQTSQEISVPFTDPGHRFATASSDFRFAASVAAFGLQLRQSPHRGTLTREQIAAIAKANTNGNREREDFVDLVQRAR